MSILVKIQESQTVHWKDTSGVVWMNTGGVEWKDIDGSEALYLSLEGLALEHFYDPYVASFTTPSYETATPYGGQVSLSFGQIILSPDAFSGDWPPPKQLTTIISYTGSTEAAAVELFRGDIYRGDFDEFGATYDIYAPKFTKKFLDVGPDYNGDTVPYPRAIGTVTHVEPLRLADDGSSRPTYHLGGVSTSTQAINVLSYSSASSGTKTKITLSSAHGWSNGASVTINGSNDFHGTHTIESVSGATFVIPVAFPTDTSETTQIHACAFISGAFSAYDDGVPIQENVVINGDGTFSLSARPVGTVTIIGTAAYTDLLTFATWVQTQLPGVGAINSSTARGTSPSVNYWATDQMTMTEFLSNLCAGKTHWFKIENGTLYLGDMLLDNGSETFTESDYFKAGYGTQNAVSYLAATWYQNSAVEGFVDETHTARFIKETKKTVVESLYTVSSGTTDGTQTGFLKDSGATFLTDGIKTGHVARNTTDDTESVVVSVSETGLELEDDIFVSGEDYVVGPSFPNAEPETIEAFHDSKTVVSTDLQNILSIRSKDIGEITIPIEGELPQPGKKLTFTDTQTVVDMSTWIRARSLKYNLNDIIEKCTIRGEGVIS